MSIDRDLVYRLRDQALADASSNPDAVSALVAAATDIMLADVGPAGAVATLEGLAATTRVAFADALGFGGTVQ